MRRLVAAAFWLCFALSTSAATPWTEVAVTPAADAQIKHPRVLLIYDMEGLSGQNDLATVEPEEPEAYARGRRLLTDDVNAVIRGLLAGGARSVSVLDGHGGAGSPIDVLPEELDRRATLITLKPFDSYIELARLPPIDAIAAVGMHAKSGSGGFWAHTYTYGIDILFNGHSVTETEFLALSAAALHIPIFFASGDDVLGRSLQQNMRFLDYVAVKKSTGPDGAELYPVAQVHRNLEDGARRAVGHWSAAKVLELHFPAEVTVRALAPWDISWLGRVPGVNYVNGGVTFTAGDFPTAYRSIKTLSSATVFNYYNVIEQAVHDLPDGPAIERRLSQEYERMWLEAEQRQSAHSPK